MKTSCDTLAEAGHSSAFGFNESCSCGAFALRAEQKSRREPEGHIHSRTYCGDDRRSNRRIW
jgi:hypothetical protein